MGAPADYVELRCRSAFSFLDGASLPEDLIDAAAAAGIDTLALADRDGVYGAPRFFAAARAGRDPPAGRRGCHAGGRPAPAVAGRDRGRLQEPLPPADPRPRRPATSRSAADDGALLAAARGRPDCARRRGAARRPAGAASTCSGAPTCSWRSQRHLDARDGWNERAARRAGARRWGSAWWPPTTSATPRPTRGSSTTSSPARAPRRPSTRSGAGCRPTASAG